jgi:hypothetical protein
MLCEGLNSLLTNNWADCVKLHNLPFFLSNQKRVVRIIVANSPEFQRSAATWNLLDFKTKV